MLTERYTPLARKQSSEKVRGSLWAGGVIDTEADVRAWIARVPTFTIRTSQVTSQYQPEPPRYTTVAADGDQRTAGNLNVLHEWERLISDYAITRQRLLLLLNIFNLLVPVETFFQARHYRYINSSLWLVTSLPVWTQFCI